MKASTPLRLIGRILAWFFAILFAVFAIAIVGILTLGLTGWGNQFLANQVASLASTQEMAITIDGTEGLLAGKLRIDRVTLTDERGKLGQINDIAVDWHPLALLTGRFEAERVRADQIDFDRLPASGADQPASDDSGFSLPVEVALDRVELPSVSLSNDILGRSLTFAMEGSARAVRDRVMLDIDAREADRPDATAKARIDYAINAGSLDLDATVAEPAGGVLATLLKLPDAPPVTLDVKGKGPLDNWAGRLKAAVDGRDTLDVAVTHLRGANGVSVVDVDGGGTIADLLPPAAGNMFAGRTRIDLGLRFNDSGMLDIERGQISNETLSLTATGKIDPKAASDLKAHLEATGESIELNWPLDQPTIRAGVKSVDMALSGPYQSARLSASAELTEITTPEADIGPVTLTASSETVDLATWDAQYDIALSGDRLALQDPSLAKLVQAPFTLSGKIEKSGDVITAQPLELQSPALGATISGRYMLSTEAIDADAKLFVLPGAVLPPNLAAKIDQTIALSGHVTGAANGRITLENARLATNLATLTGTASYEAGKIAADLKGSVPELQAFVPDLKGAAEFAVRSEGQLPALPVTAEITIPRLETSGQVIEAINLAINGVADPENPSGTVRLSANYRQQPVTAAAEIGQKDGRISISNIKADLSGNTLDGALVLGSDFLPTGDIRFDLANLGTLAALAGQDAAGDLKGTLSLSANDGALGVDLKASGNQLSAQGAVISQPEIDLALPNLSNGTLDGMVRAASVNASGQIVTDPVIALSGTIAAPEIALDARYDQAPLTAKAKILQEAGRTVITLSELSAAPQKLPLSLKAPTDITIADGTVAINDLAIAADSGAITINGTAGETLDLKIALDALPASLANSFAADLGASGRIDGTATVRGEAANPVADFDINLADGSVTALAQNGLAPFAIGAKGRLENNLVKLDARATNPDGVDVTADGTISLAEGLPLDLSVNGKAPLSFLAARANAEALDLKGNATIALQITGPAAKPAITGTIGTENATAQNGKPVTLTGKIDVALPDRIDVTGLEFKTDLAQARGSLTYNAGKIAADLKGSVPELQAFVPDLKGAAEFAVRSEGQLPALPVTAEITIPRLETSGQVIEAINLAVNGVADPENPSGTVRLSANYRQQPVTAAAEIGQKDGRISVSNIKADLSGNTLDGALVLGSDFLPTGDIRFDLANLGALAALAGQDAAGDLKGTLSLSANDGALGVDLKASGNQLSAQGAVISRPEIDLALPNLSNGRLDGMVRAASVNASGQIVTDPVIALSGTIAAPEIALDARYDQAPLTAKAKILQEAGRTVITLSELSAAPQKLPLSLKAPTDITIADGTVAINDLAIAADSGAITINGTAGETLDLKIALDALPASLANSFAADLGASGRIDGTATVRGEAANPVADFDINLADGSVTALAQNGLAPFAIGAKGRLENNLVKLDARATNPDGVDVTADGTISLAEGLPLDLSVNGKAPLSFLAARANAEALDLKGNATIALQITGPAAKPAITGTIGTENATAQNGKPVTLTGKIDVALPDRIDVTGLEFKTDLAQARGSLTYNAGKIAADLKGSVPDIAPFMANAKGKADFSLKAEGDLSNLPAKIKLTMPDGKLAGRAVKDLDVTVDALANPQKPSGTLKASGTIDGQKIDVSGRLEQQEGKIAIPELSAEVGPNRVSGAIALNDEFLPEGKLTFDLPDVGLIAALGAQEAAGDLKGEVDIKSENGKIGATVKAEGKSLTAGGAKIDNPEVDLKIADLASGQLNGSVTAKMLKSGTNTVNDLTATFDLEGNKTNFDLKGKYDGAPLTAEGSVTSKNGEMDIAVDKFSAKPKNLPVELDQPLSARIVDGKVTLDGFKISAGSGTITVSGTAGETLDLNVKVTNLPASLANTFSPGLGAEGTINGTATAKGKAASPDVSFDLDWKNAAVSAIRSAGVRPFAIGAKGRMSNNVLNLNTTARNPDDLNITANGTVGLTGSIPLNLKVNGKVPLRAAAAQLAAQGIAVDGNADLALTIGGNASQPAINGRITTNGSTVTLIRQNLVFKRLSAAISLNGNQARIEKISARLATGGTVDVSGTVGIVPGSGFPANLTIALKNAVYIDGKVVVAKLSGDLNVDGPLLSSPTLKGRVRIQRADITIPEKLPASLAELDIKHVDPPRDVAVQAAELRADSSGGNADGVSSGIALELRISAPRRIFVRGRGLDAELGGQLDVRGSTSDPSVSGAFRMIRGRLAIVGKRLDFSEGSISFAGGMMPTLDLNATSSVNSTTLMISVTGQASNPNFTFSSSPALPQDEVLAMLIFGRTTTSLSPVQIAILADAVATLAGGQSNSILSKLRQGLGVDNLDVGTDENGRANVTAGKYLNNRTYLELKQGADNSSKAVINLDIGKGVKLRGEAGADGSNAAGIFYEKEY